MIGKALETFFIRIWVIVKLTLFFWILTATGLVVAGIGPALKVITILYLSYDFDYKSITLREAFQLFRKEFARANLIFWIYTAILILLSYNLYLSVQISGLLFLVVDFILFFALIFVIIAFEYALLIDSQFKISIKNLIGLSFISNFVNFMTYLKLLVGLVLILALTYQFKGLILFGMIGLLQVYCVAVTKDWRNHVEEQLAE